jgi:CRISPR-associated protein (TIGR03986 family)
MNNNPAGGGNRQRRPARAPYNFVPLPDKAVASDALVRHNRYLSKGKYTGYFDVTLTTVTPLYIRGMLTAEQISAHAARKSDGPFDAKDKLETAEFFTVDGVPRLPGSSLRGMLRSLVEIITFSKIQPISDRQGFFFRAVAAQNTDPLRDPYRHVIGAFSKNVRAGYLIQQGEHWFIQPAQRFGRDAFAKVKDTLRDGSCPVAGVQGIKRFNDPAYTVQYHDVEFTQQGDMIVEVWTAESGATRMGVLVCTGNMSETQSGKQFDSPRRNYVLVLPPDREATRLPIADTCVADYINALTPFQKESPLDSEHGVLVHGRPVFYIAEGEEVIRFGHTPNFRIGHLVWERSGKDGEQRARAVTTHDLVPDAVQHIDENGTDYTEAMFGYVMEGVYGEGSAYGSRISVTSGRLLDNPAQALEAAPFTPKILGSPKPTTFQHYVEQPNGVDTPMRDLHHWGTKNARIRGHKLYWRKQISSSNDVRETETVKEKDTQHTKMRPVKAGVRFHFQVYFENLNVVELGALTWALTLDQDPAAHHMLGMGKPYGMGIARLKPELYLCDRKARYESLFAESGDWSTGYSPAGIDDFLLAFKQRIAEKTGRAFDDHPRIRELKTLLRLVRPNRQFDYMTIEPNEFKDRPVLPRPSEVKQITGN